MVLKGVSWDRDFGASNKCLGKARPRFILDEKRSLLTRALCFPQTQAQQGDIWNVGIFDE
jgi:hypothetical protein